MSPEPPPPPPHVRRRSMLPPKRKRRPGRFARFVHRVALKWGEKRAYLRRRRRRKHRERAHFDHQVVVVDLAPSFFPLNLNLKTFSSSFLHHSFLPRPQKRRLHRHPRPPRLWRPRRRRRKRVFPSLGRLLHRAAHLVFGPSRRLDSFPFLARHAPAARDAGGGRAASERSRGCRQGPEREGRVEAALRVSRGHLSIVGPGAGPGRFQVRKKESFFFFFF
mgnify:CR=1 FL=1|jgi:hypothetical protein